MVFLIQRHASCHAVSVHQLYRQFFRSLSVTVFPVIPYFLYGCICCLRRMDVRDRVACRVSAFRAGHTLLIAFRHAYFIHLILDVGSVRLLRQASPCMAPLVCLAQDYVVTIRFPVCCQTYGYALCTFSILVVSVIPYLLYADASLFRRITVCNRPVIFFLRVTNVINHILIFYLVCDISLIFYCS